MLAEVVIGQDSSLIGQTLRQTRFAEAHHVIVVGFRQGTEGLLEDGRAIADLDERLSHIEEQMVRVLEA